jgi:hypothetical protein
MSPRHQSPSLRDLQLRGRERSPMQRVRESKSLTEWKKSLALR